MFEDKNNNQPAETEQRTQESPKASIWATASLAVLPLFTGCRSVQDGESPELARIAKVTNNLSPFGDLTSAEREQAISVLPALIEALKTDDPRVSRVAHDTLARIGAPAVPALFAALTEDQKLPSFSSIQEMRNYFDAEKHTMQKIRDTIQAMEDPKAISSLIKEIKTSDRMPSRAFSLLYEMKGSETTRYLAEAITTNNKNSKVAERLIDVATDILTRRGEIVLALQKHQEILLDPKADLVQRRSSERHIKELVSHGTQKASQVDEHVGNMLSSALTEPSLNKELRDKIAQNTDTADWSKFTENMFEIDLAILNDKKLPASLRLKAIQHADHIIEGGPILKDTQLRYRKDLENSLERIDKDRTEDIAVKMFVALKFKSGGLDEAGLNTLTNQAIHDERPAALTVLAQIYKHEDQKALTRAINNCHPSNTQLQLLAKEGVIPAMGILARKGDTLGQALLVDTLDPYDKARSSAAQLAISETVSMIPRLLKIETTPPKTYTDRRNRNTHNMRPPSWAPVIEGALNSIRTNINPEQLPEICFLLKNHNPEVRVCAARIIKDWGATEAIPNLTEAAAREPNLNARKEMHEIINVMTGEIR